VSPSSAAVSEAVLAREVQRLLEDLARQRPGQRPLVAGECIPPVDVLESHDTVQVVVDVPGVSLEAIRIAIVQNVVIVVGEKDRTAPTRTPVSAHLIERDFGRFVRVVPLPTVVDAARATATLAHGELRITMATLTDRLGRVYSVPIERGE
jgi:HSP20 family protein